MFDQYFQLFDTLREKRFSETVHSVRLRILSTLNSNKFSSTVHGYLASIQAEGEPFVNFAQEPDQISQVKKIINALYHAEVALRDLETINIREASISTVQHLYNHTYHHVYLACHLATHFDVDLSEIFSQEIAVLMPIFAKFQGFAQSYGEGTRGYLATLDSYTIPHKIGMAGGIIIDQLGPQNGQVDYEFLTQFSALIPGYLDRLSGFIQRVASRVSTYEPSITKSELDDLQYNALGLLNALDRAREGSVFLPIKTLHYLHIIRHTITLSMSILAQAGQLNETTQDAARIKLAELKYQLLPQLFGLIDKVEVEAMLAPGTIATPLMKHVKSLYDALIHYTGSFVDFSKKGQELIVLEDSKFIAARLEYTYQRSMEKHQLLLNMEEVREAARQFFTLLAQPQYAGKRITELPEETRRLLAAHYKQIQPYVLELNIHLNNAIIAGLTGTTSTLSLLSWMDVSTTDHIHNVLLLQPILNMKLAKVSASHQFHIQLNTNLLTSVLRNVDALKLFTHDLRENPWSFNEAHLLQLEATAERDTIYNGPRPFNARTAARAARCEEIITRFKTLATEGEQLEALDDLTASQVHILYRAYQLKEAKLERAREAYDEFHRLISTEGMPEFINDFDSESKKRLRNLYGIFQPYFTTGLAASLDSSEVQKIDKAMVTVLSAFPEKHPTLLLNVRTLGLLALDVRIRSRFSAASGMLGERRNIFANKVKAVFRREQEAKPLVQELVRAERASYVIKQNKYARTVAKFREGLAKLIPLFNDTVRAQLHPASTGIPFPELEDMNKRLAQSSQVLGLKQLFNCLYHLEEICKLLESLNNDSTEFTYASTVLQIGMHVREVASLAQALTATPELSLLAGDIRSQLQKGYNALMDVHKHYIPEPLPGENTDLSTGHYAGLFYTLNTLIVLPEHISAVRGDKKLTRSEIRLFHEHADRVSTDIERIITNSDSYFKLFLEIPTMYALFRELKEKIAGVAAVSHRAAMDNLSYIYDDLLARMLLEGDRFEDSIGLKPGRLTDPLKAVLDTFYQGLIEPLGLKSQQHIALATSTLPLQKRLHITNLRVEQSLLEQRKVNEKYAIVARLCRRIRFYQEYTGSEAEVLSAFRAFLVEDFKQALPILKEAMPVFATEISTGNSMGQALDTLLNGSVTEGPRLTNVEAIATASANYFQGIRASYQHTIDTSRRKIAHLNTLLEEQPAANAAFIEKYASASFTRQVAILATKHVGLVHTQKEYSRKLMEHLQRTAREVIEAAKTQDDIDKVIATRIQENAKQFELIHYKHYYHLEVIMAAIDKLKNYVHQANIDVGNDNSTFESADTLARKSAMVCALETCAADESVAVCERIERLKTQVQSPLFSTTMLTYHTHNTVTFLWLKQCLTSLMELLGIYTPEHKKYHANLAKAVEAPPANFGRLGAQFGIFTTSSPQHARTYDVPLAAPTRPEA